MEVSKQVSNKKKGGRNVFLRDTLLSIITVNVF